MFVRGGVLLSQGGGVSGGVNANDGGRDVRGRDVGDMDKWRW